LEDSTHTDGVRILLGNPKKAVIKLSIPMIAAMSAHTIYNLADAVWVSGKGPESLSAVGFTFPFFFLALSLANGVGIGGGAAISRRIGAGDKEGADSTAVHTVALMLVLASFCTAGMLVSAESVMRFMGAGPALGLSVEYARIIFAGIVFVFFVQTAVSILRSEGDAKRAMYAMVSGVALNIVLDPVFIYWLDLGVAGAAWATVISMLLVSLVTSYWLFVKKNTYVSFKFRRFRLDRRILADISSVGLPASVSQMSMSLMAFVLTKIIAIVGGPNGVAVYTTGWRVVSMATLPMLGVASAVTSVAGAAFGAHDYRKLKISYFYALKAGVLVEAGLALVILAFASQLAWMFTWAKETRAISDDLVEFLRIVWLLLPTVPVGMLSSAMFQGVGKGLNALAMTLVRTLVFTVPFAWLLGIVLGWGLRGVWVGMAAAGVAYIPVAFGWANSYLGALVSSSESAGKKLEHSAALLERGDQAASEVQ